MKTKTKFIDRFMNEQINFGGAVMTRLEVARYMKSEGYSERQIDYFSFGVPTVEERKKLYPRLAESELKS